MEIQYLVTFENTEAKVETEVEGKHTVHTEVLMWGVDLPNWEKEVDLDAVKEIFDGCTHKIKFPVVSSRVVVV